MSQMTYRSFLLRLRKIVKIALREYELEGVDPRFVAYTGNGLYQVIVPDGHPIPSGKYTLRLHQPNYMKPEFIASEMEWLSALVEEGFIVPTPIQNRNGEWLTIADAGYEVPQKRYCTLIGWTSGRIIGPKARPQHFEALGRVMGRMHEQSRRWKPPKGFARPHWDWDGLYGEGFSYGAPAADARAAIPEKYQHVFKETLELVRETSEQLGKGKNVYGLIHADLGLAENVAFHAGEARPFDFDDCGFGYWIFDLGIPLVEYYIDVNQNIQPVLEALKSGYEETSSLDEVGFEYLNLFMAARLAQFMFFYQASGLAHPEHMEESKRGVSEHAKYLKQILKRMK
ncbi:MAG: phosphotransferase enzyme family protein [Candidatus Thorarchaeota archaeon]